MSVQGKGREVLSSLVSFELSSVIFVRDYVQLVFESDTNSILTLYSLPDVCLKGQCYRLSTAGYRDALCSFIGSQVVDAEIEKGVELLLSFEGDIEVRVSLDEADYNGPEAVMLSDGQQIRVW
jgi:hypothetical protein